MKTLMFVCSAVVAANVRAGDPAITTVTLDPSASIIWKTATAYPAKVSLLWPEGAASATLAMNPGTSVDITDTSLTEYALPQTAAPDAEKGETVVRLTLTYKDANGAAILSQAATVGFVCGTAAASDIAWRTPGEQNWSKRKSAQPVIPVPSDVTALSVDGSAVSVADVPTWARLTSKGSSHTVAWTKDGVQGEQSYKTPRGLLVKIY